MLPKQQNTYAKAGSEVGRPSPYLCRQQRSPAMYGFILGLVTFGGVVTLAIPTVAPLFF